MAYGAKYYTTFVDVYAFRNWKVQIYEKSWVGSNTAVISTDEPVTINYPTQDIWLPIAGSECVFTLLATTTGQYDEFLTAAPLQYYIEITYKDSAKGPSHPYWFGVNTTDVVRRKDAYNAYDVQLRFNDGLGELQWFFYENGGNLFNGFEQVVQIINNCMSFLPYNLGLTEVMCLREDRMSDTSGLLEQTYISDQALNRVANDGELHGYNCNQLLNYLCTSLNCRIYQSLGQWYVEKVTDRVNNTVTYFDYMLTGVVETSNTMTHSSTGTWDWRNTVSNSTFPKMLATTDRGVTQKHSTLAAKFDVSQFGSIELISNPFFELAPNDLVGGTPGPLPGRWDRSAAITAEPVPQYDSVQEINNYTSDPRYQDAYCFGQQITLSNGTVIMNEDIISNNSSLLDSTHGYSPQIDYAWMSPYYIHAVQRPGDTFSYPMFLIDHIQGSLQFNIQCYFSLTIETNFNAGDYTGPNSAAFWAAGNLDAAQIFAPFITFMEDNSGNKFYFGNIFSDVSVNPPAPVASTQFGLVAIPMSALVGNAQQIIPGSGIYPAGTYPGIVIDSFEGSFSRATNTSTMMFYMTVSHTCGLGDLNDGAYSFDMKAYAPYFSYKDSTPYNTATLLPPYYVGLGNGTNKTFSYNAPLLNGSHNKPTYPIKPGSVVVPIVSGEAESFTDDGNGNLIGSNSGTGTVNYNTGHMTWTYFHAPTAGTKIQVQWNGGYFKAQLNYGIDAIDVQYIENAQTSNGYTAFYSSHDAEQRWAELDLTVVFGDGVTNSYPGAFRLSTLSETANWHTVNLGTDGPTGQLLPSILWGSLLAIEDKYRIAMTANMIGEITFGDSILDEDGKLYMQKGHTFNIKSCAYKIDMEEMAQDITYIDLTHNGWAGSKTVSTGFVNNLNTNADNILSSASQIANVIPVASKADVVSGQSSVSIFPKAI